MNEMEGLSRNEWRTPAEWHAREHPTSEGRVSSSRIFCVRYTADGQDCRLGPYFGEVEAKQQATRLRNKGIAVHGIDSGTVEWTETACETGDYQSGEGAR